MDIGRYGMPVFSMNDRMSSSACAYAAPLPRMMSGRWALASKSSARLIDSGSGICRGAGSTTRTSDWAAASVSRVAAKDFGRQIEVDATRPPRHRRMDCARDSNADIFGLADAERRLGVGLRRVHLIEFFVVALLEIDDLAVARPADLDHRKTVGGRVGQRHHTVQKARG